MSLSRINLVVIGHKDHGKSTLIGRLLYDSNSITKQKLQEIQSELKKAGDEDFQFAFLLDTLEEEREGGLTIDIMHTPFKTKRNQYTIIDCPGHREFIKKMITGASHADAAILVVSAMEGIEDQTKQHLFLAKILGIQQIIIAVNKMDEIDYKEIMFRKICEELEPILTSLDYKMVPIIPISALHGDNVFKQSKKMEWYNGSQLIKTLDNYVDSSTPPVKKPLRACVQDQYELENKIIIVVKILTGVLEEGKEITFDPSGEKRTVQKIIKFNKRIKRAEPGDSVGIITNGIDEINRGEIISYPQNRAKIIKNFTGMLILFSNIEVRNNDDLIIRCQTAEKTCKVIKILESIDPINFTVDTKFPNLLKDGDFGKVLISPLEPMIIENYLDFPELGRFVVIGNQGTSAAGVVIGKNMSINSEI